VETLMGRAWEATPKKECRYWPGRRISKTSSRIKINYIKACQLHRRKDAGRCDESVKKREDRDGGRKGPTADEGPEEERADEGSISTNSQSTATADGEATLGWESRAGRSIRKAASKWTALEVRTRAIRGGTWRRRRGENSAFCMMSDSAFDMQVQIEALRVRHVGDVAG